MTRSTPLPLALSALSGFLLAVCLGFLWHACTSPQPDTSAEIERLEAAVATQEAEALRLAAVAEDSARAAAESRERARRDRARGDALARDLARADRDRARLASEDSARSAEADRARDVAQEAPDSLPAARQALAACTVARSACGDLAASQALAIARRDSLVAAREAERDREAEAARRYASAYDTTRVALATQTAATDTQREASALKDVKIVAQDRDLRHARWTRDLAAGLALAAVLYAALK